MCAWGFRVDVRVLCVVCVKGVRVCVCVSQCVTGLLFETVSTEGLRGVHHCSTWATWTHSST